MLVGASAELKHAVLAELKHAVAVELTHAVAAELKHAVLAELKHSVEHSQQGGEGQTKPAQVGKGHPEEARFHLSGAFPWCLPRRVQPLAARCALALHTLASVSIRCQHTSAHPLAARCTLALHTSAFVSIRCTIYAPRGQKSIYIYAHIYLCIYMNKESRDLHTHT